MNEILQKVRPCGENEHPLEFSYVFSYFVRPQGKFDPEDYALYVQPIAAFNSVGVFFISSLLSFTLKSGIVFRLNNFGAHILT